jgi:hypothetical protein
VSPSIRLSRFDAGEASRPYGIWLSTNAGPGYPMPQAKCSRCQQWIFSNETIAVEGCHVFRFAARVTRWPVLRVKRCLRHGNRLWKFRSAMTSTLPFTRTASCSGTQSDACGPRGLEHSDDDLQTKDLRACAVEPHAIRLSTATVRTLVSDRWPYDPCPTRTGHPHHVALYATDATSTARATACAPTRRPSRSFHARGHSQQFLRLRGCYRCR